MQLKFPLAALAACTGSLVFAQAQPTTINTCPPNLLPAVVNIQATVSTVVGACPLLDDPRLRSLVNQFASGTSFAHPVFPATCMSGVIGGGTLTIAGRAPVEVRGHTESAQRLFPEAAALGNPLFMSGVSSVSGAAITVVTLTEPDSKYLSDLVLSDRFTINYASTPPFRNTEDMLVVGAAGKFAALGQVAGTAMISNAPGEPIVGAPFTVSGTLCMK